MAKSPTMMDEEWSIGSTLRYIDSWLWKNTILRRSITDLNGQISRAMFDCKKVIWVNLTYYDLFDDVLKTSCLLSWVFPFWGARRLDGSFHRETKEQRTGRCKRWCLQRKYQEITIRKPIAGRNGFSIVFFRWFRRQTVTHHRPKIHENNIWMMPMWSRSVCLRVMFSFDSFQHMIFLRILLQAFESSICS